MLTEFEETIACFDAFYERDDAAPAERRWVVQIRGPATHHLFAQDYGRSLIAVRRLAAMIINKGWRTDGYQMERDVGLRVDE